MYFEGEVPTVVTGNGCYGGYNNNGGWGNGSDGWWGIILLALLFGWGRNGNGAFGGNGGGYGSGWEGLGFQLGKFATTNDVASGFSTSEIMSDLNDIILGLCQGFSGINTALLQGFHGVDNAVCTLGYQTQTGFNALGSQIAQCCCDLKTMNLENRYLNEKQTCDIVGAINSGNQRIIDFLQAEKINSLTAENVALKGQISNNAQSRYIVDTVLDKLSPCPRPAYITCNPNTGLTYPQGYTQANFGNNGCCGCNNGF